MPRSPSFAAPSAATLIGTSPTPLLDIQVDVVTPLFGGGAQAGRTDPTNPVRGQSVRGHLRFWWRACQGTRFTTAEQLFTAESAIWGNTELPSAVSVDVETLEKGDEVRCAEFPRGPNGFRSFPRWTPGYPSYALFPFQGKVSNGQIEIQPAMAREGVRFRLRLADVRGRLSADQRHEVLGAVWAWLTFGGVGARTRRGCGSLYCADPRFAPPSDPAALSTWLRSMAKEYVASGTRQLPIPVLSGAALVIGHSAQAKPSWSRAVNLMRDFRQKEDFARNRGAEPNRPGRSRWPEADAIRRLARTSAPQHAPVHPAGTYFPRADLGLPLIFQFKDKNHRDPDNVSVQATGTAATRMASPVILKALAIGDGRAVPLALCLEAPRIGDPAFAREIGVEAQSREFPRRTIIPGEIHDAATSAKVPPLQVQGDGKSARTAFLAYAEGALGGKLVGLP